MIQFKGESSMSAIAIQMHVLMCMNKSKVKANKVSLSAAIEILRIQLKYRINLFLSQIPFKIQSSLTSLISLYSHFNHVSQASLEKFWPPVMRFKGIIEMRSMINHPFI